MERISRFRAGLLLVLFAFILVLYAGRLFVLQIIETDGNTDNTQVYTTITTVRAARGDILDRNGNVLVGNRASYDLVFNHYVIKSYSQRNEALYRLVKKCQELGIEYNDHFPVTKERPFEYTTTQFNSSWQSYFQLFMTDRGLDSDITAPLLVEKMRTRYEIPDEWSMEDARAVIGLCYEFDLRGITYLPTYTFLEDVSDEHLSAILELNTPGLNVESSTVREYHTKYAAHVIGYLGGMNDDEWAEYKKQDYSMDALVGKTGFEMAFEKYLHGIDGSRVDIVNREGATVSTFYQLDQETGKRKEPIAGNNVETTLDIKLQQVVEESLEEVMLQRVDPTINTDVSGKGLDAEGAAAIVIECKTGDVLACASYPTYDISTMYENWKELEADPLKPFFNRAFGAAYAPGSTFKPCTLVCAMENWSNSRKTWCLEYGETIRDTGYYDNPDLPGFHPECLAWTNSKYCHRTPSGNDLDGAWALCYSCNVFFYELGYRTTWEMMDETMKQFGLGEPTGIELQEVATYRNNPDRKRAVYGSGIDGNFSAGDRVLGAIGQGENRFTPMQLAVYASTLANKGTRMKATFLSRVVSSDYRTLVLENEPQIANQMELKSTTISTYMDGMRKSVTQMGGTSDAYFGGPDDKYGEGNGIWPLKNEVTVYAKTGTAEHSSGGSSPGVYICFAHRSDETEPEVAIAIFGEKMGAGSALGPVAENVLMAYFEISEDSEVTAFENQVA